MDTQSYFYKTSAQNISIDGLVDILCPQNHLGVLFLTFLNGRTDFRNIMWEIVF